MTVPRPLPAFPPRSRDVLRVGTLAAVLTLAAACGAPAPEETDDETTPESSEPTAASSSPEPSPMEPFTIAFGGDVHFEGMLADRLASDPSTALGSVSSVLSEADISMVNLETAVTTGGTPAPGKQFLFRAPATSYDALAAAGVDVATVANNHGMDYSESGLLDTLDNAEAAGFPVVGAGRDEAQAYAPHIIEAGGAKVALIGATDVLNDNLIPAWTAGPDKPGLASTKGEMLERAVQAVEEADQQADAVVVYLHWGLEGDHCPLPHAPDLAQSLVDAGADAVVGGHAHVLSPGGYLGDSYVHYGLGNFAFYNFSGPTAETGVLRLTMRGEEIVKDEWLPGQIQGGVPVLYEGAAAEQARQTWEGYRASCTPNLTAEPAGAGGSAAPEAATSDK
ncbi:CapA family protein [Salinactinospora qingdaonensis]|uniref:Capsule synthesis protein CapA domain-containing protein n=1 Tax=Salinactinospora qingdaonensis TaxID=702744 RepID=A0ABP7F7B0_9ACTN